MKWEQLERKELFSNRIFSMTVDKCKLPDGRIMPGYYIFNFPDWVNVVPVTKDQKIILIRQYRHASGQVHIEIPGGSLEPEIQEDHKAAANRELQEETGYVPAQMIYLGAHYPNPALQSNKIHIYLAEGCEQKLKQSLDPYEDIEVFLASKEDVLKMLVSGEINHTIVVASLWLALNHLG